MFLLKETEFVLQSILWRCVIQTTFLLIFEVEKLEKEKKTRKFSPDQVPAMKSKSHQPYC